MNQKQKTNNTNPTIVITGRGTRISYASLFEPKDFSGDEDPDSRAVYSASLIISKADRTTLDRIHSAILAAYEAGSHKLCDPGEDAPPLETIYLPLNDGDRKRPEDPAYENAYYLNAKNQDQPRMFGIDGEAVTDRRAIYSGCYARCKIQFYCFHHGENKGIGVILLGLRKAADGEPLGAEVCTAEDFEIDEDDDDEEDFLN